MRIEGKLKKITNNYKTIKKPQLRIWQVDIPNNSAIEIIEAGNNKKRQTIKLEIRRIIIIKL